LAPLIFFPFLDLAFTFGGLTAFTFTGFPALNCSRNARCLSLSAVATSGFSIFFLLLQDQ